MKLMKNALIGQLFLFSGIVLSANTSGLNIYTLSKKDNKTRDYVIRNNSL